MGARVYIPILGRFLQVDSVEGGCLNNYVYAMDPVNQRDLSGKWVFNILVRSTIRAVYEWFNPPKKIHRGLVDPDPTTFYRYWLGGNTAGVTIDATQLSLKITNGDIFKHKDVGVCLSISGVAVYGSDFKTSESIGGAVGTFYGQIDKVNNRYKARGHIKLDNNLYDFNIDDSGLSKRNIAVGIGRAGGKISYVLTGRMPYDYVMTFQGEVYINEEWDD